MIDLHCHFLPGVDDGARTMGEALALARESVANGITTAVLTPHVYPGVFDNTLSRLMPVFVQFKAALAAAGIPLTIHLGAEVRIHPDVFDLLAIDELPVLGGLGKDRVVLLEFPDGQIPPGAETACRLFADRGIRWLIAHPERNKDVMRDPLRLKPFLDAGCLTQVTAACVVGRFRAAGGGLRALPAGEQHGLGGCDGFAQSAVPATDAAGGARCAGPALRKRRRLPADRGVAGRDRGRAGGLTRSG